jgi:hypothetical protein
MDPMPPSAARALPAMDAAAAGSSEHLLDPRPGRLLLTKDAAEMRDRRITNIEDLDREIRLLIVAAQQTPVPEVEPGATRRLRMALALLWAAADTLDGLAGLHKHGERT